MKSKEKWQKVEECRERKNKQALQKRGGRDEYKREREEQQRRWKNRKGERVQSKMQPGENSAWGRDRIVIKWKCRGGFKSDATLK